MSFYLFCIGRRIRGISSLFLFFFASFFPYRLTWEYVLINVFSKFYGFTYNWIYIFFFILFKVSPCFHFVYYIWLIQKIISINCNPRQNRFMYKYFEFFIVIIISIWEFYYHFVIASRKFLLNGYIKWCVYLILMVGSLIKWCVNLRYLILIEILMQVH